MGRIAGRTDGAARGGLAGVAGSRRRRRWQRQRWRGSALMALAFVPAPVAQLPWRVLWLVLALGGIGIVALYSVAEGDFTRYALLHSIRFTVFLGLALFLSYFRPQTFHDYAFLGYAGGILLLIATLILGVVGGGARSWLELG